MAREDTYKKSTLDSMFEDFENSGEEKEELVINGSKEDVKEQAKPKPKPKNKQKTASKTSNNKSKTKTRKKTKVKRPNINFEKKPTDANRNFRISPKLEEIVVSMTNDEKGKKIKGSRGFLKAFGTNAIVKELVHLGVLEEEDMEEFMIPYEPEDEE